MVLAAQDDHYKRDLTMFMQRQQIDYYRLQLL